MAARLDHMVPQCAQMTGCSCFLMQFFMCLFMARSEWKSLLVQMQHMKDRRQCVSRICSVTS
jgi:hypothetical protein